MLVRGKSEGKKKVWAGKVHLLFRFLVRGESECKELGFVRYMKCVPPSDETGEALRCVCLQWAIAVSAEKGHDVEEGARDRDAFEAHD